MFSGLRCGPVTRGCCLVHGRFTFCQCRVRCDQLTLPGKQGARRHHLSAHTQRSTLVSEWDLRRRGSWPTTISRPATRVTCRRKGCPGRTGSDAGPFSRHIPDQRWYDSLRGWSNDRSVRTVCAAAGRALASFTNRTSRRTSVCSAGQREQNHFRSLPR